MPSCANVSREADLCFRWCFLGRPSVLSIPRQRLGKGRLDEELGEHFARAQSLARNPLPLTQDLPIAILEREQEIPHLTSELVRLLTFEDDRQVRVPRPFHDEDVWSLDDGAEGLAVQNGKRWAHEVLNDIQSGTEQVLIDCRLAGPRLRADKRAVFVREEHGLN